MKEASGELSMTAVAIVAIAAVGVVFTTLVWPAIRNNIKSQTYCTGAVNCSCPTGAKMCTCSYYNEAGTLVEGQLKCPKKSVD